MHRLQRLPSPSLGASALLHTLGLASFASSFLYLLRNPNPINDSYGWHLQYLTIIGLSLASLTFATGLLADLTGNLHLFRAKNALSVASAPLEVLVAILYWGLQAIDPSLVEPEWAEKMPLGVDLGFHFVPALALVLDLLFLSPPYAVDFTKAFGLSAGIAVGYWAWIERCYGKNGFYPYPIFEILDTKQRTGLFAFSALLMTVSTTLLIWLYAVVNGREVEDLKEQVKGEAREKKEKLRR